MYRSEHSSFLIGGLGLYAETQVLESASGLGLEKLMGFHQRVWENKVARLWEE